MAYESGRRQPWLVEGSWDEQGCPAERLRDSIAWLRTGDTEPHELVE